jgi:predicted DCC family thiol-disulfide oxidoreductase YuxK
MTEHDRHATACAYYDGDCRLCIALVHRFKGVLAKRNITVMPLQTIGAALLGVPEDRLLSEMWLRLRDGRVFGGADAVVQIARRVWWAWPLWALSRIPGAMRPMRAVYGWIARNRGCTVGACERSRQPAWRFSALPLIVFPIIVFALSPLMPRWVFMWAMAFAIYAGCKWLTFRQTIRLTTALSSTFTKRVLGYLFAWPGMDAQAFLRETSRVARPARAEWIAAAGKTAAGILLVWRIARDVLPISPLVAGWIAMIGATFILHFGSFHLLSLCWRRAGIDAMPLMRNPMRATSLAEFWGRRWNTAFHELATRFTFGPLRPRFGVTAAMVLTFVVSGVIHELVITVPAGAAYGWPTGYFVLQGLGVAGERTPVARRLGLGTGWRGWLYTVAIVAGPVALLFPPVFVQRVILPMLGAIGAV